MLQSEFITPSRADRIRAELRRRTASDVAQPEASFVELAARSGPADVARNEIDPPVGVRERQGTIILVTSIILSFVPAGAWWFVPSSESFRLRAAFAIASWAYWQTLEPWLSGQFARPEHVGERKLSLGVAIAGTAFFVFAYWKLFLAAGGTFSLLTFVLAKVGAMVLGLLCLIALVALVRLGGASSSELSWAIALYRRGLLLPKLVALVVAFVALWQSI